MQACTIITQVFVLIFERQKPLFLQNLVKNSALKRLIDGQSNENRHD